MDQKPATIANFHTAIGTARTPAACARVFLDVLSPYGIDTFACGEIDTAVKERAVFFVIEWPKAWRDFYMNSGMLDRDPVVEGLGRQTAPFSWSELRADKRLSMVGREALLLVAEHGWTECLVVPIPRGGTRLGLVSLVGRRPPFSAEEKSVLALLSVSLHERVRELAPRHGFPVAPAGLTTREIECLALIARGHTDRDIGDVLGIAPATAREHFENARRKPKTGSRPETIAVAVSLGIITC